MLFFNTAKSRYLLTLEQKHKYKTYSESKNTLYKVKLLTKILIFYDIHGDLRIYTRSKSVKLDKSC